MTNKIFSKIVASAGFYTEVRDHLAKKELSKIERNILGLIEQFFLQYAKVPTREEILLYFEKLPDEEQKFIGEYKEFVNGIYADKAEDIDPEVLKSFLKEEVIKGQMKDVIVRMADTFDAKNSSELVTDMKELLFTTLKGESLNKFQSVDADDAKKNVFFVRHRPMEKIATKVGGLDNMLFGGVGIKEITTIIAPSGRGKSVFLVNLMYGFLMGGQDVLYLSLEMSIRDIIRRLYRRILYENKDFLSEANEPNIVKWINKFFGMTKAKGKVIYAPANSCSVDDLRSELTRLEIAEGFSPKVIIVDHLDLMVSRKKSIRQQEGYSYWRLLVDDLREIPMGLSIPIVTATQSTRQSTKKMLVGVEDVGESFGKVQSSDVVLSLNQNAEEYENKRMRVAILKNRDYYKGSEIELFCDLDLMTMCDLQFAAKNKWIK